MRLFIAEKPSLARAIADGVGSLHKKDGYIECRDDTIVTWCFGHILAQLNPDELDTRYKTWNMDDLPIIPHPWKLKVKPDAKKQFQVIKGLIGKADLIVNAGDPDREGQLLVDEVLEYVGNKKPVKRILLNALDDKSVKEALNGLRDNEDFRGLRNSALARSHADWLVGMNCSRAYSITAQAAGYDSVSVGRVQTPTMALVVRREQEIMDFHPVNHYQVKVVWHHENGDIPTIWQMPKELDALDSENRLIKKEVADELLASLVNQSGTIESVRTERKKIAQRLPYSLSALQIEAGRRYGYSPQQVLDTMQSLYEKKFTTYPRSDCDYLPENQTADITAVLGNLGDLGDKTLEDAVKGTDAGIRSRCWNDKKISAHHAIIPTTVRCTFSGLTEAEQNLYRMVALAYIAQFYPVHIYDSTKIEVGAAGQHFAANGKRVIEAGWKQLYQGSRSDSDEEEDTPDLPEAEEGDAVSMKDGSVLSKVTQPPKRFTEATLLKAMKEIYKYVKDSSLKAELKECSGIGTEATRAGIIENLLKRHFLTLEKKKLLPTEKARMAVKVLPPEITLPDTTAVWEQQLEAVSEGRLSLEDFEHKQEDIIRGFLSHARSTKIETAKDAAICPNCGRPMARRKGKNGYFWGCTGYPDCKTTAEDKNGKPDFSKKKSSATGLVAKCPVCGKNLRQIKGKWGTFWGCEDKACNASFTDHKDSPVIVKCPNCGKGYLKRFESRRKKGTFFWSCTERCGKFYDDKKGLPDV